jgi:hypothetical protein
MGFQKCPICNGTGKLSDTLSSSSYRVCDTCNGKKIINDFTGLPPNNKQYYNDEWNQGNINK